jgi:hypothetical protein
MAKPAVAGQQSSWAIRYTELPPAERVRALDACRELTGEALAVDHHADHVELGMNTGRHEALKMGACPMPGRGHHSDHGHTD